MEFFFGKWKDYIKCLVFYVVAMQALCWILFFCVAFQAPPTAEASLPSAPFGFCSGAFTSSFLGGGGTYPAEQPRLPTRAPIPVVHLMNVSCNLPAIVAQLQLPQVCQHPGIFKPAGQHVKKPEGQPEPDNSVEYYHRHIAATCRPHWWRTTYLCPGAVHRVPIRIRITGILRGSDDQIQK